MLFQTGRRKLHVKLLFSALFAISLTAIIFGSIKSFAEPLGESENRQQGNSIIATSKAEKRRPQFEPSRRLPKQISRESKPIFEEKRTNNFLEILASGDLDTTFGAGGKVTTPVGNSTSESFAVAQQADGKFVSAGYSRNASNRDFALVRYESSGTLDTTFGAGGKVSTDIGGGDNEILAVVIQPADGKIVVAGYSSNGANDDFTLARYNSNGTLDTSFGTGGIARTNFNNGFDYAEAILLQPDGKIVAAGSSFNGSFYDFALARYNSDGSPDASFDDDGSLITDFAGGDDLAFSLALQTDGKLVAAGVANTDFGLARYNSNGTLDATFDEDGKVSTSINTFDAAYAVAIQTDGKILAAGETDTGTNSDFALVRYNSNGALDDTFDTDGKISTPIGSGNEFAEALTIQSTGKIIAAGHSFNGAGNADFALIRYNADGTLDSTFGAGGKITTDFGNSANDFAAALALQSNSRIIAVGSSNLNFAAAAYLLETSNCSYSLNPTSAEIPAGGGGGTFVVTTSSGCNWVATPSHSWITITGIGVGSGSGTVTFSAQPNTGPARTGTITVGGQIFTVNQASGCAYLLSANSQNFPANGGGGSVNVTAGSGCVWTATSNVNWISISGGANGNGNGTVTFNVQANTGPERTGTLTIAGQTYTVTQSSGCTFSLNPTSNNFTAAGGSGSFGINPSAPGCEWTAVSNNPWITITSGSSGTGAGSITFTVQANVGVARTGTITAGGQTFTINQASGCTFSLSATSASLPPAGGAGSVNVTAGEGCAWTAVSNVDWITVTGGASGTGNGTVSFNVAANNGPDRSGTVTIAGQTFTVNQGVGCSYSLSPSSANIPAAGGGGGFNVSAGAGCNWTATTSDSWISITGGASGSGNGTVTFTAQANTGPNRTGMITVNGQTFTVNQLSGCAFSLSATNANFPAGGGNGNVNVTAGTGCTWTAVSNVDWISITSGANGSGTGTVNYSLQVNIGPERVGTLTIAGQTYTVTQAQGCSFQTNPGVVDYPASGGGSTITVSTSNQACVWTATSDSSWIIITSGSSGTGNGTVSYTVQPNTGPARSGIINIGGQPTLIRQDSGCTFSLTPASASVSSAAGTGSFNINASAAGCQWSASSQVSWITITSGNTGVGNGTVTFSYEANFGAARSGTISAAFGSQTFTLNQAAGLVQTRKAFDYDGDGKADLSVFRPSSGSWYLSYSSNNAFVGVQFGASGDLIAPADFDGDGKTDICVFRPADGGWYRLNSSNNTFTPAQFGTNGDLPVPGDFDGDGRADLTVYRPSAGSWYRINSSNNQFVAAQFGIAEDKPLVGDFDGDGKSDLTVYRPSNGTWYRINSATDTFSPAQFGAMGDLPVAADYDGDGKTDLAVYRPSVGDWYIINSSNSAFISTHFGVTEDKPAPADFDGDGKADLVVFRPSSGTWYLLRTTAGFTGFQFGTNGDVPTPSAFVR